MIMSMFFTAEACLFQVVTICIQWRFASSETWTGQLRINLAGLDRPKLCKNKILCLYSPILKVHSTTLSGPLRFSELGKQRAIKNSLYLTRKPCSKIIIFTVEEKLEDLASLSLNYWLTKFVQDIVNKNKTVNSALGMFTELKKK